MKHSLTCQTFRPELRRHPLNKAVSTVFVLLRDLSSVILLLLLLKHGCIVEEDREVQDSHLFVEEFLVDAVFALIGDGDAEVWVSEGYFE